MTNMNLKMLSQKQNIEIEGALFHPEMVALTSPGLRGATPLTFPHESTDSDNRVIFEISKGSPTQMSPGDQFSKVVDYHKSMIKKGTRQSSRNTVTHAKTPKISDSDRHKLAQKMVSPKNIQFTGSSLLKMPAQF